MIYATNHNATVAVDALTGKQIWRVPTNIRQRRCVSCAAASSIAAPRSTRARSSARFMDNHIIALDAKTGKEVWKTNSPEPVQQSRTAMR